MPFTRKFTPTQELVLEVLAARTRLGESWWTFSSRPAIVAAARWLERECLIVMMGGQVERTFRAYLTAEGKKEVLDDNYTPPILRKNGRGERRTFTITVTEP